MHMWHVCTKLIPCGLASVVVGIVKASEVVGS